MIEHELSPITTKDGLKLHTTTSEVDNPIAGILIIHGLGEHIGRYKHVYRALADQQIIAYGMDLRGHGQSEGKRGHTPSYDLLMDDIEELMKTFRADYNDLPMFLFGHSMGGNLVANYVIRKETNELTGFVLSSPFLKLAFEPPAWKKSLAGFMSSIFPSFTENNELDTSGLSKLPDVIKAYEEDPLVHSKITAGLFVQLIQAGSYAMEKSATINLPGFTYHGDMDPITSHEASETFSKANDGIKWVSHAGVKHEGHNDAEQEKIISTMIEWVLSRCN